MIQNIKYLFIFAVITSCAPKPEIVKYGQHYQKYNDFKSLSEAVKLMPADITPKEVKRILGEPIDNGFDYRFLVDSTGVNKCPVGAVFNIDQKGKITDRWIDEICE